MRKIDYRNLDLSESLVDVARVTKVTKGGRQFSFRAIVLVGDKKGCIGYGIAKHSEVLEAKNKAVRKAKNSIVRFALKDGRTVYHSLLSKFGSSKIFLKPASEGTGIIAGGVIKEFCEMLGVSDVIAKSYGSSNASVVIRNMFKVFSSIYPPRYILNKRGQRPSTVQN